MKHTFYSNGKLLLTGEYLVLDGAKALALPTKFGQYLDVETIDERVVRWQSFDHDGTLWYKDELPVGAILNKLQVSSKPETDTLIAILHEAAKVNPALLDNGFRVTTRLTFPRKWGLGTSSTLINNIAQWFGIDAFSLLEKSFGGSGYDIACAQHNTPIIYQKTGGNQRVDAVGFTPPFADELFFVYLNQKQNSREAIAAFRERRNTLRDTIELIDNITQAILNATDIAIFNDALEEHEAVMSNVLGLPTVKQKLFSDFGGTIKSLGAWGGDFILVSGRDPGQYFHKRGYDIIVPYKEMIL